VGNPAGAVGLEIVLTGPTLRFPLGGLAALTGARFDGARASGGPLAWNQTMELAPGETLRLGRADAGCRCWLALRGGLAVPSVLGSGSTFLPGGFGGYQGRALRAGDVLALGEASEGPQRLRALPPAAARGAPLRVIVGPQAGLFDDAGLAAFLAAHFGWMPPPIGAVCA
jgi:allophanate hydrolase subunit 2